MTDRDSEARTSGGSISTQQPTSSFDPSETSRQRLAQNLAALREYRPEVHAALSSMSFDGSYLPMTLPSGLHTVATRRDGKVISLTPSGDPAAYTKQVLLQLDAPIRQGQAIAINGIGDGYVLSGLASHRPKLFMDMELPIYLIEPDPAVVMACLLIHDYSGPNGPIQQRRFTWFVGSDCTQQFEQSVLGDLYMPVPIVSVTQGLDRQLGQRVQGVLQKLMAQDAARAKQITAYYSGAGQQSVNDAFDGAPQRRPRVMLITTRFSTVLQYSTRDTAEAFEQLGWEALTLIEPSPHHRLSRLKMRKALADFKPDLVFQIDHLRHEHGDLFPSNLPFVCWVQDNLPNLTNRAAGAAVSERDFVLVPSAQRYVQNYAYPKRQSLEFRKLTRIVQRPKSWKSDGDDLVYVSNWSQTPDALADGVIKSLAQQAPTTLIEDCCRQIIKTYSSGECLATVGDVRRVVEATLEKFQLQSIWPELKLHIVTTISERLNVGLYRQQGLRWAIETAKELGLTLSIYGNGWESNPDFAPHARGPVKYGHDLEQLTRRSKINLTLEPYVCIAHQRLLDGVVAGGFFLQRAHISNDLLASLLDHASETSGETFAEAIANSNETIRQKLLELINTCNRCDGSPGQVDFIAAVRALQKSNFLIAGQPVLPDLSEVTFDSPQMLTECVKRYLNDATARQRIANEQRRAVESRFSYVAGMRAMLDWIRNTLVCQSAAISKAA